MRGFVRSLFYLLLPKSYINIFNYFFKKCNLLYYPYFGTHIKNIGDSINPVLFEFFTGTKTINSNSIINIFNREQFFFIGSVLEHVNKNSVIVGAGFISLDSKVTKPKEIYCVRGPKTRDKYIANNIHCPKFYCDPGLIVSQVFKFNVQKIYKYGIVPHYVDRDNTIVKTLVNNSNFKILNIEDDYNVFFKELNQCEYIFSSSLHGIIFSISYMIPCNWIKFSNKIYGNDFKFKDFFSSLNLNIEPSNANMLINNIDVLKENSILIDTSSQQKKLITILNKIGHETVF